MKDEDIINKANKRQEFITDVDGYVYWWPCNQGHLAAYQLRVLADELDRLNKDWDEEVNKYFDEHKN